MFIYVTADRHNRCERNRIAITQPTNEKTARGGESVCRSRPEHVRGRRRAMNMMRARNMETARKEVD
jgi:hypothetical protein